MDAPPPPQSVGVTGHQELPAAAVSLVKQSLHVWFPDARTTTVVSSLAVGADTLVAEELLRAGAALHVIVPCAGYAATFSDSDRTKYESLLNAAETVETLGYPEPSEEAFMAAGMQVVRTGDWLIAVWDGKQAHGLGGTGDVVAHARDLGKWVRVLWPLGLSR